VKLADDLREFVALLNSTRVEYLIVGAHAVGYHGYPRYTGDIDVFIRRSPENAARVASVLEAFGFGQLGADAETFQKPDMVVQLGRPPNRIDILTQISGVEFDDAWAGREDALLDGIQVPMIGRDALLANKRASGRPKDLADLRELEETKSRD
jgi:predicted nucleotidyltransferase